MLRERIYLPILPRQTTYSNTMRPYPSTTKHVVFLPRCKPLCPCRSLTIGWDTYKHLRHLLEHATTPSHPILSHPVRSLPSHPCYLCINHISFAALYAMHYTRYCKHVTHPQIAGIQEKKKNHLNFFSSPLPFNSLQKKDPRRKLMNDE